MSCSGKSAAIAVAVTVLVIVLPLAAYIYLMHKRLAPYAAISRSFSAGGLPAAALAARGYIPELKQDIRRAVDVMKKKMKSSS
jgi:hypothetical protein